MTAPLFAAHPGGHCAPRPSFFRRLVAAWLRKPAAPEVPSTSSGAATVLLADAPRPDCWLPCDDDCEIGSVHCWNYHRPSHKPDWHDPRTCGAEPVMRDRMIADVRARWNAWHDGLSDAEIAALRPRKRLPREDGEVIIDQRERVHLRPLDCPWPRAEKPVWARPPETERADDTRVDLRIARPYAPQATYGEKPVADVLEAERLARVTLP